MTAVMLNLAAMTERTKPLNAAEKAEARRLKAQFDKNKQRLGLTQESLGAKMGMSQAAISNYLNGVKRISDLTLLRFATILEFHPDEVRRGVFDRMPAIALPRSLSDQAAQFAKEFDELSPADQQFLLSALAILRQRSQS